MSEYRWAPGSQLHSQNDSWDGGPEVDSVLPMQGAGIRSLVEEVDPVRCN